MNTTTLSRAEVESALMNADLAPEDALRESYSGRGMYGEPCFGIVVDRIGEALMFAAEAYGMGLDLDLSRAKMDGMGHGTIVYFPGHTIEGEGNDGDDD